jgi:type III pantothenate kinase
VTGLAVIDAGNTTFTVGLFENRELIGRQRFLRADAFSPAAIRAYLEAAGAVPAEVRLAGVNPSAVKRLEAALGPRFSLRVAPGDFEAPIQNLCRPASGVGLDRLFCAAAAAKRGPVPAVIIDAGTAITVDLVDARGCFQGGAIAPGVRISFEALHQQTGGLPLVEAGAGGEPVPVPGTNTEEAIRCGVIRGLAGLADRLVDELSERAPIRVVLTGGDAARLSGYLRRPHEFEPDLILYGLALGQP